MSATISIVQNYGTAYPGSTEVAKLIFYFLSTSNATASPVSNAIERPAAGTIYSYEVWIRCRCDAAPDNRCENFKFYYLSGLPATYTLTVNSTDISTYVTSVNTLSTQGTRVDFSAKDSDNKLSLSGTLQNIADYTSYATFQLNVPSNAVIGSHSVDFKVQYDEY